MLQQNGRTVLEGSSEWHEEAKKQAANMARKWVWCACAQTPVLPITTLHTHTFSPPTTGFLNHRGDIYSLAWVRWCKIERTFWSCCRWGHDKVTKLIAEVKSNGVGVRCLEHLWLERSSLRQNSWFPRQLKSWQLEWHFISVYKMFKAVCLLWKQFGWSQKKGFLTWQFLSLGSGHKEESNSCQSRC